MLLLDSNIFIYAIQSEYAELRQWIMNRDIAASEISIVEVLGYHRIIAEDEKDLKELFAITKIVPVTRSIADTAVILRQQRKMSLGDALIAATATNHRFQLITRNTADFDWIEGLQTYNPVD